MSSKIKVEVFLHKSDSMNEDQKVDNIRELTHRIRKKLVVAGKQVVLCQYFTIQTNFLSILIINYWVHYVSETINHNVNLETRCPQIRNENSLLNMIIMWCITIIKWLLSPWWSPSVVLINQLIKPSWFIWEQTLKDLMLHLALWVDHDDAMDTWGTLFWEYAFCLFQYLSVLYSL